MTTRPPTLREKRRYVLTRMDPAGTTVEQKDLYYAIVEAATTLWGDGMAATIVPAVVAVEGDYVFVRCVRGTERELMIALSTVIAVRDVRIALRIIAASGTMESLRARVRRRTGPFIPPSPVAPVPPADGESPGSPGLAFAGKIFIPLECEGEKVDVMEKGFKNTNRLFLTTEDLEVP